MRARNQFVCKLATNELIYSKQIVETWTTISQSGSRRKRWLKQLSEEP